MTSSKAVTVQNKLYPNKSSSTRRSIDRPTDRNNPSKPRPCRKIAQGGLRKQCRLESNSIKTNHHLLIDRPTDSKPTSAMTKKLRNEGGDGSAGSNQSLSTNIMIEPRTHNTMSGSDSNRPPPCAKDVIDVRAGRHAEVFVLGGVVRVYHDPL